MRLKQIIKRLFSYEGAAFFIMGYMLFSKIYGDGRYMVLTLMMCLILLPIIKKRYWDNSSLAIVSFSVLYSLSLFLSGSDESIFFLLYFAITPVFFYLFGQILVEKTSNDDELISIWWIISFLLGAVIFSRIGFNGTINVGAEDGRLFLLSDESDMKLSATVIGVYVSLGLVGLGTAIFVTKQIVKRVLWILLFFLSVSSVVFLINRTGIVVAAIVVMAMLWYKSDKKGGLVKYGLILFLFLLSILWLGLIDNSVLNAYGARADEDTAGDRFRRWGLAIHYLFQYPFGWANETKVLDGYIHNMWFDAARKGGIMCFILLLYLTIVSGKRLLNLLKNLRTPFTLFAVGLYVCFFFSSMVEPIIDALPQYLMLFMLLWGMIKRYYVQTIQCNH